MLDVLKRWYQTRFSDPDAVTPLPAAGLLLCRALAVWGSAGTAAGGPGDGLSAGWPVSRLQRGGLSRTVAASLVLLLFITVTTLMLLGLIPTLVSQGSTWPREAPAMLAHAQDYVRTLPEKYPEIIDVSLVETIIDNIRQRIPDRRRTTGERLFELPHQRGGHPHLRHPGAPDGLLHAQGQTGADGRPAPLPAPQPHPGEPGLGGDERPDHQLHPRQGDRIVIVGIATYVPFALMGLRYSALLAVAVGFSVLIPISVPPR